MTNVLDQSLRNNVWGNPKGDWQFPIIPELVSPPDGYKGIFRLGNVNVELPDNNSVYNVYTAGSLNPELIKLLINNGFWTSFVDVMKNNNMFASAYTDDGLTFCRKDLYYTFGRNRSLLIALRRNSLFDVDYSYLNIAVRFFIPAYLDQNLSVYNGKYDVFSMDVLSNNALTLTNNFISQYNNEDLTIFINGYLSNASNIAVNQAVDVVYDPQIKAIYKSMLNTLPVFYSELDQKRKYLFHVDPTNIDELDFISNIDFYLVIDNGTDKYGLYVHRNNVENIRNVTFHDYSILTNNIQNLISNLPIAIKDYSLYLVGYFRHSPYGQNLINTDQELLNFYKIEKNKFTLLAGKNDVSIYNASKLEMSPIMRYITSYQSSLYNFDSLDVAGYNSITKLVCSPLVNVENTLIEIPECFSNAFTAYEFSNGILNLYSSDNKNGAYQVVNGNTDQVLFINGSTTNDPNSIYIEWSGGNYSVPTLYDFRVYGYNGEWSDITNNITVLTVMNNNVLSYPEGYSEVLIKTNQYTLNIDNVVYIDNSGYIATIDDPNMVNIPYGFVDVYLNGFTLIYGIDYFLIGNDVYVTNVDKLLLNDFNKILISCYGFCNSDLTMPNYNETKVIINNNNEQINSIIESSYMPSVPIVNSEVYNNQTFTQDYLEVTNKVYPISLRTFYNKDTQTFLDNESNRETIVDNLEEIFNSFKPKDVLVNKKILLSPFLNIVLYNSINHYYDAFITSDYTRSDIGMFLFSLREQFNQDPLFNDNLDKNYYRVLGCLGNVSVNKFVYDFYSNLLIYYKNDKLDIDTTLSFLQIVF